jgi:hypothetical protein
MIEQLCSKINPIIFIYPILFYTICSLLKLRSFKTDQNLLICYLLHPYSIHLSNHIFLFSDIIFYYFSQTYNLVNIMGGLDPIDISSNIKLDRSFKLNYFINILFNLFYFTLNFFLNHFFGNHHY